VLPFDRQNAADGILRPDDWPIFLRKRQQAKSASSSHPGHEVFPRTDDHRWIASDPIQPSNQPFLPHLAQHDIAPTRVCRQAEQIDHNRPGEILRHVLQVHDESLASGSVRRERGRYSDQVSQHPLGTLQRERAVIAGRIRSQADVFGCAVRKGQSERVLFVDCSPNGTYLCIASKETEKMGLFSIADVVVNMNRDLRVGLLRIPRVLKAPQAQMRILHRSPLSFCPHPAPKCVHPHRSAQARW